ncbi:MAG: hypothetical protein KatS3mg057_2609 [Herpetosiphonaceae bacterium]|nr:MAG: hypothetical protein KatS3mg057_2609 [Herpetosiphonaceae bacterium]
MDMELRNELVNAEAVEELAELDLYAEELPERLNNAASASAFSCLFSYSCAGGCVSCVSSFCTVSLQ